MNRRKYLLAVAGASAVAGCGSEPERDTPRTTTDGVTGTATPGGPRTTPAPDRKFGRIVNAVEDANCDPTGSRPCSDAVEQAVADDTLLVWPEGRYQFDRSVEISGVHRFGMRAEGDVSLRPPPGFRGRLVKVHDVDRFTFRGITIDIREPNTTAGLQFHCNDHFRIEDVTYRGRGTHPDHPVPGALFMSIANRDGSGILRNAVAREGSAIGHYRGGDGRAAVWIGPQHLGTIRIEGCRFEEFGNNGIYASRTSGNVQVVNCFLRNNNVSSVRISGGGSYVRDTDVVVDLRKYTGPMTRTDRSFKTRGIVVERGHESAGKPPGALVENCTVAIRNTPNPGPAIQVWSSGRTLTVRNSTVQMLEPAPVIYRDPAPTNQREAGEPTVARWIEVENTKIVGRAPGWVAIGVFDGPGSVIRQCSIDQTGRNRDGIQLVRSSGCRIDGGSIATSRYPLVLEGVEDADPCLIEFERLPDIVTANADRGCNPTAWVDEYATPGASNASAVSGCLGIDDLPGQRSSDQIAIHDVRMTGGRLGLCLTSNPVG